MRAVYLAFGKAFVLGGVGGVFIARSRQLGTAAFRRWDELHRAARIAALPTVGNLTVYQLFDA